jgi:hypothetical protein
MKFALNKWEPQVFKAETQAMAAAVIGLAGYLMGWPVEVVATATVIAGYVVGMVTVKA